MDSAAQKHDITHVYICSAGHSGSTLLDMMLGSHSRAESVGELIHLPMDTAMNKNCTCGESMRNCPLWSKVLLRMGVAPEDDPYKLDLGYVNAKVGDSKRSSWIHVLTTRFKSALTYFGMRYGIPSMEFLTPGFWSGIRNTQRIYETIREITGKDVIVDSSKHYLRAAALYRLWPESTRIIVLVRDGRGVFYSSLKRGFGRHYSLTAWHNHYRRAIALFDRYVPESHRLVVHYEDLVTNPAGTLAGILDFLNIEFEDQVLDPSGVVHHNVNGNDIRFSAISELRLDEGWKVKMSVRDLQYFERKAGELNHKLGYV